MTRSFQELLLIPNSEWLELPPTLQGAQESFIGDDRMGMLVVVNVQDRCVCRLCVWCARNIEEAMLSFACLCHPIICAF